MNERLRVRLATVADVTSLAQIHLTTVVRAYTGIFPLDAPSPTKDTLLREWQDAFTDSSFRAFLAEDNHTPIGTVAIRSDPDVAGCGQLRRLNVLPDRWRQGTGSTLYDTALEQITDAGYQEAGLWVLERNSRARLYEHRGWQLVPGQLLEWHNLGVIEVRYRLPLK